MRARLKLLPLAVLLLTPLAAGQAAAASCGTIQKSFAAGAGMKVDFIRPVVVSRGQGDGADVFDIVTDQKIDGQLRCRGDKFLRFNARFPASADQTVRESFIKVQHAGLISIVGWSAAHADRVAKSMAKDAAEYLFASIERGDVDLAGKVEEHAGALADIGMIYTPNEREFIIAVAE